MKYYSIDELRPEDHHALKTHLDSHFGSAKLGSIYWIELDSSLYNQRQSEHPECQPFYMAVELNSTQINCELLVRSKNRLRCSCIGYADPNQRNWIIEWMDRIFDELDLKA